MTQVLCPICGSEVILTWTWHPMDQINSDDTQELRHYLIRCSNPFCEPHKVKLEGKDVNVPAVMQGAVAILKEIMTDDYMEQIETRMKEDYARKVEELKEEKE